YIYPVIVLFGCQFLVKLFSLNRRFKIKAPDLAIPFLWGGMHASMLNKRIANKNDYKLVLEIWEKSVKQTHDFLAEADFNFYKAI
ncbi:DUF3397 family protein, partial [Enterococcus faecium]|uniref:DUF3397 family protein n=1 Tax=Enterococcus faecium TaxID=1352 RepID=UPI00292E4D63